VHSPCSFALSVGLNPLQFTTLGKSPGRFGRSARGVRPKVPGFTRAISAEAPDHVLPAARMIRRAWPGLLVFGLASSMSCWVPPALRGVR
jgi:hypothetical protein